ncbi:MAG: prepilin-type N-terminal cleavage/methylation domain-containing protein [Candidatus Marinimicrobia bacterium]|nr:prepilin-type N-terminal cleavage/methylation domain-containing protein [Candidatus Neomarinimicrobiota bacterium]
MKTSQSPQRTACGSGGRVPRRGRGAGFTLVEVVITAFLSALMMAGVIGLIVNTLRATAFSGRSTQATQLAQERMEQILASEGGMGGGSDSPDGFDRIWSVDSRADGGQAIEVRVTWHGTGGRQREVALNSLSFTNAPASAAGLSFQNIPQLMP